LPDIEALQPQRFISTLAQFISKLQLRLCEKLLIELRYAPAN
jgi:hypothetical protein